MTAPYYGFLNTPEYQRKVAKLNREERNLLSTMLIDENEGERQMKHQITLMALGQRKKFGERALGLRERGITERADIERTGLASRTALREQELAQRKELGLAGLKSREDIAKSRIASQYGIESERLGLEESQYPWKLGIGLADVAAGTLFGLARRKQAIGQAEETDRWRKKIEGVLG